MAIIDAVNRITGKNVGGSIEDALAYLQMQNEGGNDKFDPTFVPVFTVTSTTEDLTTTYSVTADKALITILTGFNDGNVKQCVVNVDGVAYQTSMISTSLTMDQYEDPDTSILYIALGTVLGGTNVVVGTYTYGTETESLDYIPAS